MQDVPTECPSPRPRPPVWSTIVWAAASQRSVSSDRSRVLPPTPASPRPAGPGPTAGPPGTGRSAAVLPDMKEIHTPAVRPTPAPSPPAGRTPSAREMVRQNVETRDKTLGQDRRAVSSPGPDLSWQSLDMQRCRQDYKYSYIFLFFSSPFCDVFCSISRSAWPHLQEE